MTVYHDWDTGFDNGIHSYMGTYCGLTPDPSVDQGTDEASAEPQYYEVAPDSSVHPLGISRNRQNAILYADGSPGDGRLALNFMQQAFAGETDDNGNSRCLQPLVDISSAE